MFSSSARVAAVALCAALWPLAAAAQSPEAFFKDKTLRFIVGTGPGGGYDTYGRLLVAHMRKHIPGQPAIVVQNMPGASGVRAVNFLYEVAPKDGTIMATFNQAMPAYELSNSEGVRFKSAELGWIGSMSNANSLIVVWHDTGVKTVEDARKVPVVMGALTATGTMATYPTLLNNTLGTRFRIVTGYESGSMVDLAIERGEVKGRGSVLWSSYKSGKPAWIAERKINVLVQIGLEKEPDLPDVPLLIDLAQTPLQRALFELASGDAALGRPIAAPPGVPADRLAALRAAFDAALADPALLSEAASRQMEIAPTGGARVQQIVQGMFANPPEVIAAYNAALTAKDTLDCYETAEDKSRCAKR